MSDLDECEASECSNPADGGSRPRPILKFVGGKTRLLPELLERVPPFFGRYYEPFVGGGALFFALEPERATLSDVNADLISLYRVVASDVEALIRRLEVYQRNHDEDLYYAVRDLWNDESTAWSPVDRAAAFVYLNKTCFNGVWRVNKSGKFNVPAGRYADPKICAPDAMRAASAALARADLRACDFTAAVADARRGDLVYFDPPYVPTSPTADFTSYTSDGFGEAKQRLLAEFVRLLVARGVYVLASNSDTPLARDLYAGMRIDTVRCGRAVNSRANGRGEVTEILVVAGGR